LPLVRILRPVLKPAGAVVLPGIRIYQGDMASPVLRHIELKDRPESGVFLDWSARLSCLGLEPAPHIPGTNRAPGYRGAACRNTWRGLPQLGKPGIDECIR